MNRDQRRLKCFQLESLICWHNQINETQMLVHKRNIPSHRKPIKLHGPTNRFVCGNKKKMCAERLFEYVMSGSTTIRIHANQTH